MSTLRIGVIVGSTRPRRHADAVAGWVIDQAAGRAANYELVDLVDHALPLLDEPVPPAAGRYQQEHTLKWAATIAPLDGFVFVSPEYNHSTSAALKNAIDYLYAEWNNKAAAFVTYGMQGGLRAAEHLRAIATEMQLAHVRQQVAFSMRTDFEGFRQFNPAPYHERIAQAMFDQLEAWAGALKPLRN